MVDGREAIRLRDSANDSALLIEAADPHLPVRLERRGGSGTIGLSAWNAAVHLSPPAGA